LGVSLTDKQGGLFFNTAKVGVGKGRTNFWRAFRVPFRQMAGKCMINFEKRNGITLLGCLAHVRRKFKEAQDNDKSRAAYVLSENPESYTPLSKKARNEDLDYKARKTTQER
jgi:hypothetical protein